MRYAAALSKIEFAGRRGWGRRLRMMAAAMVAVLALAGSLIVATERAGAQSTTTLVSNLNPDSEFFSPAGPRSNGELERAGAFTTGTNDPGYALVSVTLKLRAPSRAGTPVPEVVLHSDSNGNPGGMLVTLDNPSNISSISNTVGQPAVLYTFDLPSPRRLEPTTVYWIVVYATGHSMQVVTTDDPDQNSMGLSDWSIADDARTRFKDRETDYTVSSSPLVMKLEGRILVPTRTESADVDLPYSDETWGFVDTSASSSGRMDATHDSRRRTGDWWKLRVEPHRRYRVEVQFGSGSSQARGGGIDVNYNDAWWDHNRDDGLAFIEFTTISEPHYLRVQARDFLRDFLNEGPATYHGPYTVTLTDITGITKKVSNRNDYSGTKTEVSNTLWKTSSFDTGDNAGGYKLSYVATGLHDKTGTNSVKAELWTAGASGPDTKIFDFQRAGEITGHPTAQRSDRFWAPSNAANLATSTAYWVVFKELNSGAAYDLTRADSGLNNPGAASGWSYQSPAPQNTTTPPRPPRFWGVLLQASV